MLSPKWAPSLLSQGETGMGYQVVTVILKDGRRFEQAMIVEGRLTEIRGLKGIPFTEAEIVDLKVTHAKWNWNEEK